MKLGFIYKNILENFSKILFSKIQSFLLFVLFNKIFMISFAATKLLKLVYRLKTSLQGFKTKSSRGKKKVQTFFVFFFSSLVDESAGSSSKKDVW